MGLSSLSTEPRAGCVASWGLATHEEASEGGCPLGIRSPVIPTDNVLLGPIPGLLTQITTGRVRNLHFKSTPMGF